MIYFVHESLGNHIKIGYAGNPSQRLYDLQTSNPGRLTLLLVIPGEMKDETELHLRFSRDRVRGEWFQPSAGLLTYILECAGKHVSEYGSPVSQHRFVGGRVLNQVIVFMRQQGDACVSVKEIAAAIGEQEDSVRKVLNRYRKHGFFQKTRNGWTVDLLLPLEENPS